MPRCSPKHLVLAALLLTVVGVWQFVYHGVDPALIWNPPPAEPHLPAGTGQLVSVDVDAQDLNAPTLGRGVSRAAP